jgi:hypothetical protein
MLYPTEQLTGTQGKAVLGVLQDMPSLPKRARIQISNNFSSVEVRILYTFSVVVYLTDGLAIRRDEDGCGACAPQLAHRTMTTTNAMTINESHHFMRPSMSGHI